MSKTDSVGKLFLASLSVLLLLIIPMSSPYMKARAQVTHTLTIHVVDDNSNPISGQPITVTIGGTPHSAGDGDTFTIDDGEGASLRATSPFTVGGDTYRFDHWEDACTGTATTCDVFMDADKTVTAVYVKEVTTSKLMLTVSTDPVSPAPGRVDPIMGVKWIDRGKTVTLKARSFAGYFFDHWEVDGKDAGNSRTLRVKMDSNHRVVAHFVEARILKVYVDPNPRAGTVLPSTRSLTMWPNTMVTLEAKPFKGYVFDHWEVDGKDAGTEAILQVRMDEDHVVVAYFRPVITAKRVPESLKDVGFPADWKYYALPEDERVLRDLLSKFLGWSMPDKKVVILTTAGKKFPEWSRYSVRFLLGKDGKFHAVRVLGHVYERGTEKGIPVDAAVILLDFKNERIVISGITTKSTRAALLWLLRHPEASNNVLIVIKWVDLDKDGVIDIEEGEVFPAITYGA